MSQCAERRIGTDPGEQRVGHCKTGTPTAPAYYLMFGAAIGLLAALFLKERARDIELSVAAIVEPHAAPDQPGVLA